MDLVLVLDGNWARDLFLIWLSQKQTSSTIDQYQHIKSPVRNRWITLAGKYSSNDKLISDLFDEVLEAYTSAGRHYHSLHHIHDLLELSEKYSELLTEKDIVDFSIFYHDIIYNTRRSDNESQSAALASDRLARLNVPAEIRVEVAEFIDATKTHQLQSVQHEKDLAFFLDFDMSVLASDWSEYQIYIQAVEKEYSHLPFEAFRQGRRSFIMQTLSARNIYHTDEFHNEYEEKARRNLKKELTGMA
jgi:predicted metal-dependent HD superfamily phosphohydrolase